MSGRPEGHAAAMDRMYRGQRHIYDLTRKYYLLGRDQTIGELDARPGMAVLEVGCGTGRNLIAAARRWPQAVFFGLDISAEMLASARRSIARAGLSDRIHVAQGDATRFDPMALFGVASFDRIMQSYTLSMIPDWQRAVREAVDHLASDGMLLIVDFGQQERLPAAFRRALVKWLTRFHVTPRAGLPDLIADLGRDPNLIAGFMPLRRGYAWQAKVVRRQVAAD